MPSGFIANRVLVAVILAGVFGVFLSIADRLPKAGWSSQIDVALAVAVALGIGVLIEGSHRRVVRFFDRLFLPRRHARTVALDRIAVALRERGAATSQRVVDDIGDALGLASVAIFARTEDDGFVRRAAFGWPAGSVWHLLPGEKLTRELHGRTRVIALANDLGREIVFPAGHARPCVAVTAGRRNRVERAILLGPDRSGGAPDPQTMRGLAAVLDEAVNG